MIFIRSATNKEGCKYVLADENNIILKKYYEEDEPVDFTKEVNRHLPDVNNDLANAYEAITALNQRLIVLEGGS